MSTVACTKNKEKPVETASVYNKVSTLAGSGSQGYLDGAGAATQFNKPEGLAVDAQGNVYVADEHNSRIRKITPAGLVSTLAGTGIRGQADGTTATAQFDSPTDLAFDGQGNLYVADFGNHNIRKITPAGVVSTLAGSGIAGFANGPGAMAQFNGPIGIAVDAQGTVYLAEFMNNRIRKVMPNGTVSTLAGTGQLGYADGPSTSARFGSLEGLALDGQGNLYAADYDGARIRKIAPNGTVSTLAGTGRAGTTDGAGSQAQFIGPTGLAIDAHGDLFVTDAGNNTIRKVTPAGIVSTVAGTGQYGHADGPASTAWLCSPLAIAAGSKGVLYFAESNWIRKLTAE